MILIAGYTWNLTKKNQGTSPMSFIEEYIKK